MVVLPILKPTPQHYSPYQCPTSPTDQISTGKTRELMWKIHFHLLSSVRFMLKSAPGEERKGVNLHSNCMPQKAELDFGAHAYVFWMCFAVFQPVFLILLATGTPSPFPLVSRFPMADHTTSDTTIALDSDDLHFVMSPRYSVGDKRPQVESTEVDCSVMAPTATDTAAGMSEAPPAKKSRTTPGARRGKWTAAEQV